MSCLNPDNGKGKGECCFKREPESYKKIECFECHCHKKNICDHKDSTEYSFDNATGEYEG